MEIIISIIVNLLGYVTGNKRELPDFDFTCERSPMSDNNPLLFLINVANKSKNDYSITEAIIFKVNPDTKKMFVYISATMKETDILPARDFKNREDVDDRTREISSKFSVAKNTNQLRIPAKESRRLFIFHELDQKTYEYWNNFRRKTVVNGFIDENGKVYPTWRKSDEWELALKDDKNIYWVNNRQKINFPVLQEECRLNELLSFRIREGNPVLFEMIKSHLKIFFLNIKYQIKRIALVLGSKSM